MYFQRMVLTPYRNHGPLLQRRTHMISQIALQMQKSLGQT